MKSVLVIVLSYNKKDMLLQCLSSLARQNYQPCHVVVVDNGSSDGSVAAVRECFPELAVVRNAENVGAIAGRNLGVAYARSEVDFDYILFLDDDAEVGADSIGYLVEAVANDEAAGIACGKTYTDFSSDVLMSTGILAKFHVARCYDRGSGETDRGQYDMDAYVDAGGAFALMVKAGVFDRLGGLDDCFSPYGWEEVDLCLRAKKQGYLTKYVHRATFCHRGTRLGRGPVPAYERNKVRNYLTLMRRHMTVVQMVPAVIFLPIRALALFVRFGVQGSWGAIPAQLRGILDYIGGGRDRGDSS